MQRTTSVHMTYLDAPLITIKVLILYTFNKFLPH